MFNGASADARDASLARAGVTTRQRGTRARKGSFRVRGHEKCRGSRVENVSAHGSDESSWGVSAAKAKALAAARSLRRMRRCSTRRPRSFREPKIELIDGQVSREELLKAPSSFRRFMEATRRAKEQRDRRDERARVARGSEGSDDESGGRRPLNGKRVTNAERWATPAAAASLTRTTRPRTRGFVRTRATAARASRTTSRSKKPRQETAEKKKTGAVADADAAKDADGEDDAVGRKGKRKYKSLRERKSEARKAAKAAREEGDAFIGVVSDARLGGRMRAVFR